MRLAVVTSALLTGAAGLPSMRETASATSCPFARVENKADGGLCETVSSERMSCAACSNVVDEFEWEEVDSYITAVLDADPTQGDAAQCPSQGVDWFNYTSSSGRPGAKARRMLNMSRD